MPTTSLIHADIFFFISTIALVIISAGIVTFLVYAIGIAKNVRDISDRLKAESVEVVVDIQKLRRAIRDEGMKWGHVANLIRGFFMHSSNKETVKKTVKREPKEPKESKVTITSTN